jgi:hypothetical protein
MFRISFSTLVAGLATSPYVIYHFNQFSTYSILTNIVAIPLSDFVIMPLSIVALILMPLHLDYVFLMLAGYSIDLMLWYAKFISRIPFSSLYVAPLSAYGLVLFTLGGFLLCVLNTRLKFLGMLLIIIGMLTPYNFQKPDVLIEQSGKIYALNINGHYQVSVRSQARFLREAWEKLFGIDKFTAIDKSAHCYGKICSFKIKDLNIVFAEEEISEDLCSKYDFIISKYASSCANKTLNLSAAKTLGHHFIFFEKQKIILNHTINPSIKRKWSSL